ncbi:MAG: hypothetical protein AAF517_00870 [Planctomycetota bacterium]
MARWFSAGLAIAVLVCVVFFREYFVDQWYIYRLDAPSAEERVERSRFLVERGVVRSIPRFLEIIVEDHKKIEEDSELDHDEVVVSFYEQRVRDFGSRAAPHLVRAFEKAEKSDCRRAIISRILRGDPELAAAAVDELTLALATSGPWAQAAIVATLTEVGPLAARAVPELWKLVDDADPSKGDRQRVLLAIHSITGPSHRLVAAWRELYELRGVVLPEVGAGDIQLNDLGPTTRFER